MRLFTPTLAFAAAVTLCITISPRATRAQAPTANAPSSLPAPAPSSAKPKSPDGHAEKPDSRLQEKSRLEIVRFVDGEFAKAVVPLPRGKKGFKLEAGKPINAKELQYDLRDQGVCANAGDRVQITKIEFGSHQIEFQINGGGKKPFHLLQHLQIGIGPTETAPPVVRDNPNEGLGTTLILDFGQPVPDLTADQVKAYLGQLLDFSSHSATVNWIDTLPPPVQQAIKEHHAIVGMDQEMVTAAMGRPDKKVRSRDPNTGNETEDWIYGAPPARTTFVTFSGEKVIRVKVFQ
ncbi:MAG TPA: hypothetical protein VN661_09320 [Candidatus Acidoferrales bacterium]|nr:hypothetical protein [Candidatus Acidoferrales bacterium]